MDWLGWIEAGIARFREFPAEEQWLSVGTGAAALLFAALYWSRFGNRRAIAKCGVLAFGLHLLGWAYAERYEMGRYLQPAPTPRPQSVRVPIQLANREMSARQELASLRRELHAGIAHARLPEEALATPPIPQLDRRPLEMPKAEKPAAEAPQPVDLTPKGAKFEATKPAAAQRSALEQLSAAPAKELAPVAQPKLAAASPREPQTVVRRDFEAPPIRRYTPPDAVIAVPSALPLGPVVERLAPLPAAPNEARPASGGSLLGSLAAVAPPPRPNTSARPPARKSPLEWTDSDIEKLGSGGLSRDIELVLNRAEENRRRLLERHGGSSRTERAVQEALAWLAAHQDLNGRWGCTGFSDRCPQEDQCAGLAIEKTSDCGVTGLALLAFLGAGHTPTPADPYGGVVQRGLDWLIGQQQVRGHMMGDGNMYSHAMATLALTEAFMLTGQNKYKLPAQEAVDYMVAAQHPSSGGWRYGPGQFGDTSVYGWVVLGLRSAEQAGLKVPETTWRMARRWLTLVCSGVDNGLAAYQPNYQPSPAMTAEALVCKQILGTPRSAKDQDEAGRFLLANLPDQANYHVYYWYYGTIGMFQLGGVHWQRWNDRLTATLLDTQEKTGHRRGSWEPRKPFGVDGGRVFSTACSALCLEVYYRYLPLYQQSGRMDRQP